MHSSSDRALSLDVWKHNGEALMLMYQDIIALKPGIPGADFLYNGMLIISAHLRNPIYLAA